MKFLIVSDLHIEDKSRWSLSAENEDLQYVIQQLKNLPKETFDVDAILVCGDTTDKPKENATVIKNLRELFDSLNPLGKPVYVINGNHDAGNDNYLESIHKHAEYVGGKTLTVGDCTLSFMDYCNDLDKVREFLKQEGSDIKVIHQSSAPFIGLEIEGLPILHVEDYPTDTICLVGDTHVPGLYDANNKFILSPGSLYPHNKTELCKVENFLMILETNDSDTNLKAIPLKKRSGIALESSMSLESIKLSVEKFLTSEHALKPFIWVPDFAYPLYATDDRAVFKSVATYKEASDSCIYQVDKLDIPELLNIALDEAGVNDSRIREASFNLLKTFVESDDPNSVELMNF